MAMGSRWDRELQVDLVYMDMATAPGYPSHVQLLAICSTGSQA